VVSNLVDRGCDGNLCQQTHGGEGAGDDAFQISRLSLAEANVTAWSRLSSVTIALRCQREAVRPWRLGQRWPPWGKVR